MLSFFLVVLVVASGAPPEYCTIMSVRDYVKSWLQEQEPHRLTYQWTVLDEIYHWNTSVAWEKTDREHELLETGNFVQREFIFLDYSLRARKNKDGTTLAAVYFYDECIEGASIVTDVLDFNEEPFEMRCTDAGDFKGWRVGARLPAGSNAWYEKYEGYSVRANFDDWDFNIIQKYSGALEMQPDQVID